MEAEGNIGICIYLYIYCLLPLPLSLSPCSLSPHVCVCMNARPHAQFARNSRQNIIGMNHICIAHANCVYVYPRPTAYVLAHAHMHTCTRTCTCTHTFARTRKTRTKSAGDCVSSVAPAAVPRANGCAVPRGSHQGGALLVCGGHRTLSASQ